MKKWKVEVTQQDIDAGLPAHPRKCPVACAMMRAGLGDPFVNYGGILFYDRRGARRWCELPRNARSFMGTFDAYGRGRVAPFTLELVQS